MTIGKPVFLRQLDGFIFAPGKIGLCDRQTIGGEDLLGFDLGQGQCGRRRGLWR